MCGIIGYTGSQSAVPILLEGLHALEYRGYDSAGVCVIKDGALTTVKSKGRIQALEAKIQNQEEILSAVCGIGHTRWATHGEPSDVNSHPHGTERVSIVHNGIIENYAAIKEFLASRGYTFESQTDTEAAAKLLDWFYSLSGDPLAAIKQTRGMLRGSYAIGAMFCDFENKIYAFRKDNPLIAAQGDNGCFIASDLPAVLNYTSKYLRIKEGETAVISPVGVQIYANGHKKREMDFETAEYGLEAAQKDGYPHFMLKEIHEEPEALLRTLRPRVRDGLPDLGVEGLDDARLRSFERIHITGCGTALHAGLIGKYAAETLAQIPVEVDIASEFRYKNCVLDKSDLVMVISQSGETADSLAALRRAKQSGAYTLAVVNVTGSSIAREADGVIYTWAGPEIAVASTKAYTVQLCIMYLFALRLAYARRCILAPEVREYVRKLSEDMPGVLRQALQCREQCAQIAKKYKDAQNAFFIGRGLDCAVSMEAALKLKEIAYIHSEACAAGEIKHVTMSLISAGTPVFAFAHDPSLYGKTVSNLQEVRSRGAKVILFCPNSADIPSDAADDILRTPDCEMLFSPLPAAVLFQLTAYCTALELGRDIDRPRNLAKSVTVE